MTVHPEGSLARRLWIYRAERFPLVKTGLLLAVFVIANINVSARLGYRVPTFYFWTDYVLAWLVTMIIFFQMRAADEIKDLETDRHYRPERAIPRGLVSLRLIVGIAAGLAVVALGATLLRDPPPVAFLVLVWVWLGLMTVEFFVPRWLKARPFLYLVSHMMIMPLIARYVTASEWWGGAEHAPDGIGLLLGLAFLSGCVLEVGRKLYAPENERTGVETYSALLGVRRAAALWVACVAASAAALVAIGERLGALTAGVVIAGAAGLVLALAAAFCYAAAPTPRSQSHVEMAAGLWVFVSYAVAGSMPLVAPFS